MANKHVQRRARQFCNSSIAFLVPESSVEDAPLLRPCFPGFACAYAVDGGDHFEFVTAEHLASADLELDALHRRALRNLTDRVNADLELIPLGDGTFELSCGGDFEASMLLLEPLWDTALRGHIKGEFLAIAPTADVLVFGDNADPEATEHLNRLLDRFNDDDERLGLTIFERVGGAWVAT